MIDLVELRANPTAYQQACDNKHIKFDVSAFLDLDRRVRELKTETERLRAEQNAASKDLQKLAPAEREGRLAQMKELSTRVKDQGVALRDLEAAWLAEQLRLPGIPLDTVPVGASDKENIERRKVGMIPEFGFKPKEHFTLGAELDIIDIERGVKIAGSRNYFLKGDGYRLQHAVMNLASDLLHGKGYTLMDPPHIVLYRTMMGTGYFPGGEDQAYHLDDRDPEHYLIGTSEVSVAAYHSDEVLERESLPRRYAGYSPCYRREAGTYGKDTAGLYRVHQFYKVEQVILCEADPQESAKYHAELLGNAEELLGLLELPYRVVDVCTGDMGQGQVYKNDIECWMPSRNGYGETHSCSTFYDYQARRLNTRYKDSEGKLRFCHTLNNTLIASPRVLIPLIEVHQTADGSVMIPKALRPYMGGLQLIS